MPDTGTNNELKAALDEYVESQVPGLQYIALETDGIKCEYAGGYADILNKTPMTLEHSMMGYSMTKTFTAVAILQLFEAGSLGIDEEIDGYLPDIPYAGKGITIRQLVNHTSGIPNPVPLRWAHLAEEDTNFDEDAALLKVLHDNPELAFVPGEKYAYSNIGYWLLGKIISVVSGQSYQQYMNTSVLSPLGLTTGEIDFVIPDPNRHSKGYLAKYSLINLLKRFFMDSKFWEGYEGNWLHIKALHLNGPSFGGLIGSARSFARFLQDQLKTDSALFSQETKNLLETQQTNNAGDPIPMTLGWHLGEFNNIVYFYKEGGGGGFRSEMRLYPEKGIGSVVMVNRTNFSSTKFLNNVDGIFL